MWDLRYSQDGWAIEDGQYQNTSGGKKRGLPDWYNKQPELVRGDEFYIRAFWELSTCRQFGQSFGPIPWHRILQYGLHKRLDRGMIDVLEVVVRELDEEYLRWLRDNQKRQRDRTQGQTRKKAGR